MIKPLIIRTVLPAVLSICVLVPGSLGGISALDLSSFCQRQKSHPRLSDLDKAQLSEALDLKDSIGDLIWPGFGSAEIPLILYNQDFEFLIGMPDPPPPWISVEDDHFQDQPYFHRPSSGGQAFAVPVGDPWAGSLNSLDHMNESMEIKLKEQFPPEKLTPAFLRMMRISPAQYVAALLHEAFHAFEAVTETERFLSATGMYGLEDLYPFSDDSFNTAWNREGNLLIQCLNSPDHDEKLEAMGHFLETRAQRRETGALSQQLTAFEQELEWLEGLAKYVELKIARYGMELKDDTQAAAYRIVWNRLQADLVFRLRSAGEQKGDLRFYLSGAVQALILDDLYPDWKHKIAGSRLSLEDLLREIKPPSRSP